MPDFAGLGGRACLSKPPDDARFVEIVRGHLHLDAVADRQPDPALAHLSADGGKDEVFVVEFHPEHRARKHGLDAPFHFNMFFFHRLLERRPGFLAQAASIKPAKQDAARQKNEARCARAPNKSKPLD